MVELTAPHFINGRVWPIETRLDVAVVTPLMLPLDEEAAKAIRAEKIRVFGRWIWDSSRGWYLLDDPPIERPLTDNQPVPALGAEGGPGR